ncbi:hypothetical protein NDU88_001966 [Pleurodeles waltl]|uniref:Uncharacterized protein n=1 Tax=Pleurodeles waltl TaxID=8319 RepID=A0AAV7Q8K4_PLEWA|nr:hypothetical protein NDU88_001966 [Pleurodeles waltl]
MAKDLPQEVRKSFGALFLDAQAAAQQIIQSGLDTTDSIARAMGTSVAMRRHAWLRSSGFSSDVQSTLMDLPFDGEKLFGDKADSALERFKDCRATAKSLGLQAPSATLYRPFRRFQGFARGSAFRRSQSYAQQPANPPYRAFRGRGRGRARGPAQQLSSSSSSSGGQQQKQA